MTNTVGNTRLTTAVKGVSDMEQTQIDLLIELVRVERIRLTFALTDWNIAEDEMRELNQERGLATSTLKALQEVGISWEYDSAGGE